MSIYGNCWNYNNSVQADAYRADNHYGNGNGKIDNSEFGYFMQQLNNGSSPADLNGDGYVDRREGKLAQMAMNYGSDMAKKFAQLDKNRNGKVTPQEVLRDMGINPMFASMRKKSEAARIAKDMNNAYKANNIEPDYSSYASNYWGSNSYSGAGRSFPWWG